ncbi:MAG TPA: M20/M25/M40 family metallo-hydrolase [Acidobacteriota bacterium]|nr:M20/M25/M40 family metallo-hydrolase [Acidobacteriota bacterium]
MPRWKQASVALTATILAVAWVSPASAGQQSDRYQQLATEILREMVESPSVSTATDETAALLEIVVGRLAEAGFEADDMTLVRSPGDVPNLVVRYVGTGTRRPVMLMAHVDVVGAEPGAWQVHPFTFVEEDGYYYGRGTSDNKAGATTLVTNFIRLRQEGYSPDRDLIMVLTGDEETTGDGINHLVNQRRDLVDAELALNTDSGGGAYDPNGEPQAFKVQTSEKLYQSYELETANPGGHSSLPRPDNAIYRLAKALGRIESHSFPIELNAGTRLFFERSAALQHGSTGDLMRAVAGEQVDIDAAHELARSSPLFNATLRTTCVATMLSGGHAENALPRAAKATVNCRILPGRTPEETEVVLREVVDDEEVSIRPTGVATPSQPSAWDPELMGPIEALVQQMWPGTPVIPNMGTGATDGLYVRNAGIPVYALSAIFSDPDDSRAHGLDERVGVKEFHDAIEFWYRMLKRVSS